jgi:hypothetical protein
VGSPAGRSAAVPGPSNPTPSTAAAQSTPSTMTSDANTPVADTYASTLRQRSHVVGATTRATSTTNNRFPASVKGPRPTRAPGKSLSRLSPSRMRKPMATR